MFLRRDIGLEIAISYHIAVPSNRKHLRKFLSNFQGVIRILLSVYPLKLQFYSFIFKIGFCYLAQSGLKLTILLILLSLLPECQNDTVCYHAHPPRELLKHFLIFVSAELSAYSLVASTLSKTFIHLSGMLQFLF